MFVTAKRSKPFQKRRRSPVEKKIARRNMPVTQGYIGRLRGGRPSVSYGNIISEWCTALLEMRLQRLAAIYLAWMISTMSVFAVLYYLQALLHGDIQDDGGFWKPCVYNANSFADMLKLSATTQLSYGYVYGPRVLTGECATVALLNTAQIVLAHATAFIVLAVLFSQMMYHLPKKAAPPSFSKHAVVMKRNGKVCLVISIDNVSRTHLAQGKVRMEIISKSAPKESPFSYVKVVQNEEDALRFECSEMHVDCESARIRFGGRCTVTVVHEISRRSPFFPFSKFDGAGTGEFKIVADLKGMRSVLQFRKEYFPSDIIYKEKLLFDFEDTAVFASACSDNAPSHWTTGELTPVMAGDNAFSDFNLSGIQKWMAAGGGSLEAKPIDKPSTARTAAILLARISAMREYRRHQSSNREDGDDSAPRDGSTGKMAPHMTGGSCVTSDGKVTGQFPMPVNGSPFTAMTMNNLNSSVDSVVKLAAEKLAILKMKYGLGGKARCSASNAARIAIYELLLSLLEDMADRQPSNSED
ncbi:hypothetical protein QR680_000351 [Steinernema hermaphroditum]|uniref:Inward rectifier potassium channel C-terminal domain-containing protein n=1 Tax=Steinernema hermaphroditum TaxID=289476 RepID=A0AA39GUA5_9BILA|nr:hypothetical protein QR680_000351 [Steinernema hermaphroditum]